MPFAMHQTPQEYPKKSKHVQANAQMGKQMRMHFWCSSGTEITCIAGFPNKYMCCDICLASASVTSEKQKALGCSHTCCPQHMHLLENHQCAIWAWEGGQGGQHPINTFAGVGHNKLSASSSVINMKTRKPQVGCAQATLYLT